MRIMLKRTSRGVTFIASSPFLKPLKLGISVPPEVIIPTYNSKVVKYTFNDRAEFIKLLLLVITSLGIEGHVDEAKRIVAEIPEKDYKFWIDIINRIPRERVRQRLMRIGKAIREIYTSTQKEDNFKPE